MARGNLDPYRILGVPPAASQAEIANAYRARLRSHHPDTRPSPSSQDADELLREVVAAYDVLRDPTRRAEYDRGTADFIDTAPTRITVTHRRTIPDTPVPSPPLWAGPVRRHR
jgi:curved DNA-binding protein CbpA